jgi:hypothetical protein
LLISGEGYALSTKQIIVSSESWRRVLQKWKRQVCAQENQAKYIPIADNGSLLAKQIGLIIQASVSFHNPETDGCFECDLKWASSLGMIFL